MKEEKVIHERERSIWVPLVVGSVIGAGVALLFAPKSGKELRKDIENLAAETKEKVALVVDRSREMYDASRTAVTDAIEAGKTAYVHEVEKHRKAA